MPLQLAASWTQKVWSKEPSAVEPSSLPEGLEKVTGAVMVHCLSPILWDSLSVSRGVDHLPSGLEPGCVAGTETKHGRISATFHEMTVLPKDSGWETRPSPGIAPEPGNTRRWHMTETFRPSKEKKNGSSSQLQF